MWWRPALRFGGDSVWGNLYRSLVGLAMAMKPYRCRQGHIESGNRVTLKRLWYSTILSLAMAMKPAVESTS